MALGVVLSILAVVLCVLAGVGLAAGIGLFLVPRLTKGYGEVWNDWD